MSIRPATSMRTHLCGELRASDIGPDGQPLRMGGTPPRARREARLRRPPRPHRRHPVRRRQLRRRPQRVRRPRHRRGRRAPEGTVNAEPADRRGRARRLRGRGAAHRRAAAVPDRRSCRRRRREHPAAVPLPRHPPRADAAQPAHPCRGQLRDPSGDGATGLRRGRDTDARAVHAGGRPRVPRARRARSRARSTPCRRARSCSSSC